jgi:hypothetical protein
MNFWRTATPESVIPVTTEAVESLEETAQGAFQDAQTSGEVSLVVTEAQLTSIFTLELEERVGEVVNNLQLSLRDGQIQMTGDIVSESITAPVEAVIEADVDPAGRPILNVISANVGPFPVPGDLVSEVEATINKAFQDQIKSTAPEMRIEKIIIENGKMTISGRTK